MKIDILLATYNGARFLREQIGSLLAQTHREWRVIARDDGSSDDSPEILDAYAQAHPERFLIIKDRLRLGAKLSFSALMQHADAPYVALCDQDDFWRPEKLSVLLQQMQDAEELAGQDVPVLIHSDLEVVNQEMETISPSFWAYQGIDPVRNRLGNLLVDNTVTGCTILMNQVLLRLAQPVPEAAYMHDYWLALVAATVGRIVAVRQPLVRYRQHGSNTLGAVRLRKFFSLPGGTLNPAKLTLSYVPACEQAAVLVQALTGRATQQQLEPAARFARLYEHGALGRRWLLIQNGSLPARWRRRISVLVRV